MGGVETGPYLGLDRLESGHEHKEADGLLIETYCRSTRDIANITDHWCNNKKGGRRKGSMGTEKKRE